MVSIGRSKASRTQRSLYKATGFNITIAKLSGHPEAFGVAITLLDYF
jgi:hypothetical protein